MGFSLKMQSISGIYPSESIRQVPWKLNLYHCCQIIMYIFYFPVFISQILNLYHNLEDLETFIDDLAPIGIGIAGYIPPLFVKWDEVYKSICRVEIMPTITKIIKQNDTEKMEILQQTKYRLNVMIKIALVFGNIIMATVLFETFIIYHLETAMGIEREYRRNSTANNMYETLLLEKLPFAVWLPKEKKSIQVYSYTYLFLVITLVVLASKIVTTVWSFLSVLMYVSLQFKFINMALENLNTKEEEICRNEAKNDSKKLQLNINSNGSDDPSKPITGMQLTIPLKETKSSKSLSSGAVSVNQLELTLKDIIRDHQYLIWFVEEINKVWKISLFILQCLAAIMFTVALFQISQNKESANTLKYTLVATFVLTYGGLACFFGELLKTQSGMICESAYNVHWYKHSTNFKKMLQMVIMRAQKPCCFKIGGVHEMTMEHFQNVVNMSYTYFTLLLQLNTNEGRMIWLRTLHFLCCSIHGVGENTSQSLCTIKF